MHIFIEEYNKFGHQLDFGYDIETIIFISQVMLQSLDTHDQKLCLELEQKRTTTIEIFSFSNHIFM